MTFPLAKIKLFYFLTGLVFMTSLAASAQDFPKPMSPPRIVNDYANLLTSQESNMLESKLRQYRDSTSTEMAIVIVETVGQNDIDVYAVELAEEWGIGGKKYDNGIIILVAQNDRKVSIKTGYGMEGPIPDAYVKRVIDRYIIPNFKQEKYFEGLDQATSLMMSMASGEFKADPRTARKTPGILSLIIVFFFVIVPIISVFRGRRGHFSSRKPGFWTMLFLMSSMNRGRGNTFNDFNSGRGSFGGGSDFGGFGGGSFGGGGASGSW
ncbi:MAG: TPM domain-containing protein [Imperialibacter sp.]|uniref:TPM domain-containing protein n=1 Tax=Imperialibacter sp. TaxID=2038411 RepID=UPI0032EAD56F